MTEDCYIEKIVGVRAHDNADRLEIARVRNWDCVVGKGEFKIGDNVLYIQPDATVAENIAAFYGGSPICEAFASNKWSEGIRKYLGTKGRVKTVRLRGKSSYGIVMHLSAVKEDIIANKSFLAYIDAKREAEEGEEVVMEEVMGRMKKYLTKLYDENVEKFIEVVSEGLDRWLGISHYVAPIPQDLSAKSSELPPGVEKSDETNYQALRDSDLHLGEEVLVTRKKDGSSGTVYYNPNNDYFGVYSRSLELKPEFVSDYTVAMNPLQEVTVALAKHYGEPIALRGEICCVGRQSHKNNIDCQGPPTFYMYGVRFPENEDEKIRMGRWKSGRHFTDIVKLAEELGYTNLVTVPVLGTAVISKEQLETWAEAPASEGEGVVVNGETFTYKIRSAEYDSKL